ncbi:MAG: MmgE/PrpD [Rhodospirillaceae bacterium]|nr:MmgE/PrpD [Rhodospirillaceae bacterium]|tara:strand:- start:163 stop:1545 length:1383 start_codon:yes stop_codon:yes gene_type:complete
MNTQINLDDNNPVYVLAKFISETKYEDIPLEAIKASKTFILDTIGVGIAGSNGPWVENLIKIVQGWGAGDDARVLVHGTKLPKASAAIVNAYQIHCLEYDCVNEDAVLHPMATIMGAILSEIDSGKVYSGKDLITAVAVGVDSSSVLGLSSRSPMRFFRPSTAGAFGATAAIAKLRGFNLDEITNAFGATYGQISGTLQPHLEGSPVLGMQIGFCARAAISACDLAKEGLNGPKDVFSGKYGYLSLFEGEYDYINPFNNLGSVWQVSRLSHKPFPSGRLTHGMVDGVQRLMKNHKLDPDIIDSIRCIVPPLAHRLTGRPDMENPEPNYAKLCIPFVTATAIIAGTVDVSHFESQWLLKDEVHKLAQRIQSIESDEKNPNVMSPQFLEIYLKNKEVLKVTIPSIYGHPDNPLSDAENKNKFLNAWKSAAKTLDPSKAKKVISLIENLESIDDISGLIDLTL